MKFRRHRYLLEEAMRTVVEINPTIEALIAELEKDFPTMKLTREIVHVEKYGKGIDTRIGWDDHIVVIDDFGPIGFTDGPLISDETEEGL